MTPPPPKTEFFKLISTGGRWAAGGEGFRGASPISISTGSPASITLFSRLDGPPGDGGGGEERPLRFDPTQPNPLAAATGGGGKKGGSGGSRPLTSSIGHLQRPAPREPRRPMVPGRGARRESGGAVTPAVGGSGLAPRAPSWGVGVRRGEQGAWREEKGLREKPGGAGGAAPGRPDEKDARCVRAYV